MRSHCTRADCLCTVHCCSRTTRVQSAISREASMWCDDAEAANADFLSPRITAGDERTKSKITKDLGLQGKEAASKPTAATASRCSDAARERVVDVARWTALPLELGRAESRWRGEEGKVEEANDLLVRVGTVGIWFANRWAELERGAAKLETSRAQLDRKTLRFSKLIQTMHAWQRERNADASGMPEPPTRAESNETDPTRLRLLAPTTLALRMFTSLVQRRKSDEGRDRSAGSASRSVTAESLGTLGSYLACFGRFPKQLEGTSRGLELAASGSLPTRRGEGRGLQAQAPSLARSLAEKSFSSDTSKTAAPTTLPWLERQSVKAEQRYNVGSAPAARSEACESVTHPGARCVRFFRRDGWLRATKNARPLSPWSSCDTASWDRVCASRSKLTAVHTPVCELLAPPMPVADPVCDVNKPASSPSREPRGGAATARLGRGDEGAKDFSRTTRGRTRRWRFGPSTRVAQLQPHGPRTQNPSPSTRRQPLQGYRIRLSPRRKAKCTHTRKKEKRGSSEGIPDESAKSATPGRTRRVQI